MSFWQFLGSLAVSDKGETIQRMGKSNFFSSDGTVFTKTGKTTVGSDGSIFTQTGNFSSDGSSRIGNTANGIGAVFNDTKSRNFTDNQF
jgi:hypothetical protein